MSFWGCSLDLTPRQISKADKEMRKIGSAGGIREISVYEMVLSGWGDLRTQILPTPRFLVFPWKFDNICRFSLRNRRKALRNGPGPGPGAHFSMLSRDSEAKIDKCCQNSAERQKISGSGGFGFSPCPFAASFGVGVRTCRKNVSDS